MSDEQRPRRTLKLLVLGLLLFLVGLVVFRLALAELGLRQYLEARGITVDALTVESLDFAGVVLSDVRLGADEELAARRITLSYKAAELVSGQLQATRIEGLRLRLDLSGAGPPLGELQKLVPQASTATGEVADDALSAIPDVIVSDARLDLSTPLGPVELRVEAEAWSEADNALAATATLDVDSPLGQASAALSATRQENGDLLGDLVVSRGRLRLPGTVLSGLSGEASFQWPFDALPLINAEIQLVQADLEGEGRARGLLKEARLVVDLDAESVRLQGTVNSSDDRVRLMLDAAVEDFRQRPEVALQLYAEAEAATDAWSLLALPRPAAGQGTLLFNLFGDLPPLPPGAMAMLPDLPMAQGFVTDWLRHAPLDGTLLVDVGDLALDDKFAGLSGTVTLELNRDSDGQIRLRVGDGGDLRVAQLSHDWLTGLGLPTEIAELAVQGFDLSLSSSVDTPPATLAIQPGDDGARLAADFAARVATPSGLTARLAAVPRLQIAATGDISFIEPSAFNLEIENLVLQGRTLDSAQLEGSLSGPPTALEANVDLAAEIRALHLPPFALQDLALGLSLDVSLREKVLQAALRTPGTIGLVALSGPAGLALDQALAVSLTEAEVSVDMTTEEKIGLHHKVKLEPGRVVLQAPPLGSLQLNLAPLTIRGRKAADGSYQGELDLAPSNISAADVGISASRVGLQANFGAELESLSGRFGVGELSHLTEPALAAPLRISGSFGAPKGDPTFELQGSTLAGLRWLSLSGHHKLVDGVTSMTVTVGPLAFQPDGLQPVNLSPRLALLTKVLGHAEISAKLRIENGAPTGIAAVVLHGLEFDTPQAKVRGLNLDLALDSLWPPGSPVQQQLKIAAVDPGVAIKDVRVAFQVAHAGTESPLPRLRIEDSEMRLLGGRVFTDSFEIDPNADVQKLLVKVEALELATLFDLLAVEGLTGGGLIEGQIPLTLVGTDVIVEEGWLATRAPGRLRLKSEAAANLLSGSGDEVTFLLRALEDFHYRTLKLSLDKSAEDDLIAKLSLLGNNPDVLDGQDFQLNLNLESNIGQILSALGEAFRVSNEALRRTWQLR